MCDNHFLIYNNIKRIGVVFWAITLLMNLLVDNDVMAKQVQVCDWGVYKLYDKAYSLNKMVKSERNFDQLNHIGEMYEDSLYDNYCTSFGAYGHAALVTFYANKAGYVSKITIFCKYGDTVAENNAGSSVACILLSLGLSKTEFDYIMKRLTQNGSSDVWVERLNRRIVIEMFNKDNAIEVLRITAYDS